MKPPQAPVSALLTLARREILIDPGREYRRIGIYSWGKGFLHRPVAPGSELGSMRYFTFPSEALVLSNIQAWEAAIAVSGESELGHVGSNRFLPYVPRVDGPSVDIRYLFHYFLSEDGLHALRRASPGTQVRNRTLGRLLFESLLIPVPPIAEQRRIASHLGDVAKATASIGVPPLRPLNPLMNSLPWNATMSDIVRLDVDEFRVAPTDVYRAIGVLSHGRGVLDRGLLEGSATKYKTLYRVKGEQLILSRLKAFEGAVALAGLEHNGAVVSREFPTFSLRPGADPEFVRGVIGTPRFRDQLASLSAGIGARRERIGVEAFLRAAVPNLSNQGQAQVGRICAADHQLRRVGERRAALAANLLPAARNEIFSAMR